MLGVAIASRLLRRCCGSTHTTIQHKQCPTSFLHYTTTCNNNKCLPLSPSFQRVPTTLTPLRNQHQQHHQHHFQHHHHQHHQQQPRHIIRSFSSCSTPPQQQQQTQQQTYRDHENTASNTVTTKIPPNADIFSELHQKYKDTIKSKAPRLQLKATTQHSTMVDSNRAVWIAIVGNLVLTIAKFGAHLATGSSTMLSESVHSLADTLNQCLLAVGIFRAQKPASMEYPYGHAREAYVWALVAAVGIFFLGAGAALHEGVNRLSSDAQIQNMQWCTAVLVLALLVEGFSLFTAFVAIRRAALSYGTSMWEYVARGPDPLAVAVLLEDGAAVLGVLIAAVSLGMYHVTGHSEWDAVGSIAIGLLLGVVAMFLIRKNKDLLVGRGIDQVQRKRFIEFMTRDPVVHKVSDVKTEMMGVGVLRFKAEVHFDGKELTRKKLSKMDIQKVWADNCSSPQELEKFLVVFGDEIIEQLGDEIDRLEREIVKEFPDAAHVDLEAD